MGSQRRFGSKDSATRTRLLDAAADLMRTDGHGKITARRLAEHAGLSHQIVHYYFRSMEDLFIAVVQRSSDKYLELQQEALKAENPIRKVWELVSFPNGVRLEIEFMSLANHFDSARRVIADFQIRSWEMQAAVVGRMFEELGTNLGTLDPEGLMVILRGTARAIVMERNIGLTRGHDWAIAEIERHLERFDRDSRIATGTKG